MVHLTKEARDRIIRYRDNPTEEEMSKREFFLDEVSNNYKKKVTLIEKLNKIINNK